jgi:tetratricopeptide (TPR) repeat protein
VKSLFAEHVRRPDVIDRLQRDHTLDEDLRKEALAAANRFILDPQELNDGSWFVVRKAVAEPAEYRRALFLAQEACRLEPENGYLLATRGMAEYRTGQFQQALKSLSRSIDLNTRRNGLPGLAVAVVGLGRAETFLSAVGVSVAGEAFLPALPADLAFLSMAHYQLGQQQEALQALARLRAIAKQPKWVNDPEVQGFLREAEALIQKRPPDTKQ